MTTSPDRNLGWRRPPAPPETCSASPGRGPSLFAAVGRGGVILTSPDGVTWTRRTSPTTNTLAAVPGGAQFIAAGNAGVIVTSPNGTAWTSQSSNTTSFLNAIGLDTFIAVGEGNDTTSGGILTSPDGVTWTQRALSTTNGVFGVVWSGTQFRRWGWAARSTPPPPAPPGQPAPRGAPSRSTRSPGRRHVRNSRRWAVRHHPHLVGWHRLDDRGPLERRAVRRRRWLACADWHC